MSSLQEDLIEYANKDAPPLMRTSEVTYYYEHTLDGELVVEHVVTDIERTFTAAPGAVATVEEAEAEDLARAQAKILAEGLAAVVSSPSSKTKGGRL